VSTSVFNAKTRAAAPFGTAAQNNKPNLLD
jgi:hypothetical protein